MILILKMDKQEGIKELGRLEKVASIRKDMYKVMPLLGHRVKILKLQLAQLPSEEKDLIRSQLDNALDETINMVKKISHNFQVEEKKLIPEFSHQ
jgi:hypothetical protein